MVTFGHDDIIIDKINYTLDMYKKSNHKNIKDFFNPRNKIRKYDESIESENQRNITTKSTTIKVYGDSGRVKRR